MLNWLMGHQTQQAFLSHPSIHPSWLGVALILTVCVCKSLSLFMHLQLRVLLVLLAPELLKEVSVVCMYSAVSRFIILEQLTRSCFTFVPVLGNILARGVSLVPESSCLSLLLHNPSLEFNAYGEDSFPKTFCRPPVNE